MTETVDRATARKTSLIVAAVLSAFAAWQLYRGRPNAATVLAAIGVVLAFCGVFVSPAAVAFHRGWMALAAVLGYVNSRILLGIVYYGMMAPIGAVVRLTGHDPLDRRHGRRASYWTRRPQSRQSREQFERAF